MTKKHILFHRRKWLNPFYKINHFFVSDCHVVLAKVWIIPLLLCLLWGQGAVAGNANAATQDVTVRFVPDTKRVLRNPLNGWVLYLGRNWTENFWTEKGYDAMKVPGSSKTVKVSDYASTCYIRTSWRSLEPQEGQYTWNDPNARLTKLLQSARKRHMRLAFRIVVDGRDQGLNTPQYVFDAGAGWYADPTEKGSNVRKSPYPDDPVFQQKYAKFIKAFARRFNNPDEVDFIDAYGLGKWGEAHSMVYKDYANKGKVFEWVTDLYSRTFTKVPLIINYHRLVGANNVTGWGEVAPDTEDLLNSAIRKGYSLRHDAFGMNGYYQDWEKAFAAKWNYKRPIIMEGGWITGGTHRYWIDPSGKYRKGHSEDVRLGEYEAAKEAHVNMMDFRVGDETDSWFTRSFPLVQAFVSEGGYRLYPSEITLPQKVRSGQRVTVRHCWNNLGWGYCPTNIPQWNQRYKVAMALMDKTNHIVKVFVDESSDLSKWLKGKTTIYNFTFDCSAVPKGTYKWMIGLVDTTRQNRPGLEMAVQSGKLVNGWAEVSSVSIF